MKLILGTSAVNSKGKQKDDETPMGSTPPNAAVTVAAAAAAVANKKSSRLDK